MDVREVMTYTPETVAPETAVNKAQALMQQYQLRHLPVMKDGHLVGIVSDRDIRSVLPSPSTRLKAYDMRDWLGQVMTRRVMTVPPDIPLTEAIDVMLEHKIGALPVIEWAAVVGMLTRTDVLRAYQMLHDDWLLATWDDQPLYLHDEAE